MALQNCSISQMNQFLNSEFYIPNYQREYTWEDPEIGDLWDDLQATIQNNDTVHFFGQIVVHCDGEGKKYIIDGQQRTITSMIFMRTLQIFYEELNVKYANLQIEKGELSENQLDIKSNAADHFSDISAIHLGRRNSRHLHLSDPADDRFFCNEILFGYPQNNKLKKKSYERMRKAYGYFHDKMAVELETCNSDLEIMGVLDKYYDTFTKKFSVLYMEATKLEEAFVIFETLNARGRDLETSDLLKNFIFRQSNDVNEAEKKWNQMIDRLDGAEPTKYIRYYWNSSHEFTREKELYRSISKIIDSPSKTKGLLDSLVVCAQCYHDILYPEKAGVYTNPDLITCLKALKALRASTFYPVLLAVQQSPAIREEDRETFLLGIVRIIEIYVFRNIICNVNPNTAERVFASLARDIYRGELNTLDQISVRLSKSIVDNGTFRTAFEVWEGTGSSSSKDVIRYILRKIHKYYDRTNELNLDNSEVHIEHIMPEDATKWNVSEEDHEGYLWRLGNLALLSGKLNKQGSNRPFEEKKAVYAESWIKPNRELVNYAEWTPKEIEERQEKFAKIALEIWAL